MGESNANSHLFTFLMTIVTSEQHLTSNYRIMCKISQMTKGPSLFTCALRESNVLFSSAYEGKHDDDEGDHHEPQHPRVDIGGVGEHGDGDGSEDEEAKQHHPEHVAHA